MTRHSSHFIKISLLSNVHLLNQVHFYLSCVSWTLKLLNPQLLRIFGQGQAQRYHGLLSTHISSDTSHLQLTYSMTSMVYGLF